MILQTILDVLNPIFSVKISELYGRPELNVSNIFDFNISRWPEDALFRGTYAVWTGILEHGRVSLVNTYNSPSLTFQGKGTATRVLKENYGVSGLNEPTLCV